MTSLTLYCVFAFLIILSEGCNIHTRNHVSHPHRGRRTHTRRAEREVLDWDYSVTADWHTINPEYAACNTGTSQSPINLLTTQGLAISHRPSFSGYTTQTNTTGTLFNWGFGPGFTLSHSSDDFSTLPSMTFDDQTVFLSGFHIHTPSEHLVDNVRSKAEMHLVHVDATGAPKSVVGIRIDASLDPNVKSAFMAQLPESLIHFNDTQEIEGLQMDMNLALAEVGGVSEFWTYQGSLTTPPCSEGLRWFVPARPLMVSQEQMIRILGVARFSHRQEQVVWSHQINI